MFVFSKGKDCVLRVLLSLLIFGAIFQNAFAGFEDRRFDDIRIQLIKDIENLLISSGECSSIFECQKRQIIFASPKSGGVTIQLWGIKNTNTLQSIITRCLSSFLNTSEMEAISVEIYSIGKRDSLSLPFWKPAKPEIDIILRRNK